MTEAEWRTREGQILKVKDMEIGHIRNCLKLAIRAGTLRCIKLGARHCTNFKIDEMEEEDTRQMLMDYCLEPKNLRLEIIKQCFGPHEYSNLVKDGLLEKLS
jgi:hypothetical protein